MYTVSNKELQEDKWEDITSEKYDSYEKAEKQYWKLVAQYIKLKVKYSFDVKLTGTRGEPLLNMQYRHNVKS